MRFDKYYFENFPPDVPFDEQNPRCVLAKPGVDEVLSAVLTARPGALRAQDTPFPELARALCRVEVLRESADRLYAAAPAFLASDAPCLAELSRKAAEEIAQAVLACAGELRDIVSRVHNGFSPERNLYHLLCGDVLDGALFDDLECLSLLTVSKPHPSGLDYLVTLYESCDELADYSNGLLCSFNRLTVAGRGFVTFGDSRGNRHDFYRAFRQRELGRLSGSDAPFLPSSAEELVDGFCALLDGQPVAESLRQAFAHFGYLRAGEVCVPVLDASAMEAAVPLHACILLAVSPQLARALSSLSAAPLTCLAHGVPVRDVANEVYHLIFGEVNERLVRAGLVENPPDTPGEGRFLRAFVR